MCVCVCVYMYIQKNPPSMCWEETGWVVLERNKKTKNKKWKLRNSKPPTNMEKQNETQKYTKDPKLKQKTNGGNEKAKAITKRKQNTIHHAHVHTYAT